MLTAPACQVKKPRKQLSYNQNVNTFNDNYAISFTFADRTVTRMLQHGKLLPLSWAEIPQYFCPGIRLTIVNQQIRIHYPIQYSVKGAYCPIRWLLHTDIICCHLAPHNPELRRQILKTPYLYEILFNFVASALGELTDVSKV